MGPPRPVDAKLNGGYIVLGLVYGNGDFGKTTEVATRAGQDSDCNPASAGGILRVMLSYGGIPDQWKSGINAIADQKFQHTDYTFKTIVDSMEKRALALSKQGGRLYGDTLIIKTERPKAPKLEVWDDFGSPRERVALTDARWSWTGDWTETPARRRVSRNTSAKGAEVTLKFEGTGVIVVRHISHGRRQTGRLPERRTRAHLYV